MGAPSGDRKRGTEVRQFDGNVLGFRGGSDMGSKEKGTELMEVEEESSVVPSTGLLCGVGSVTTRKASSHTGPALGTESRLR